MLVRKPLRGSSQASAPAAGKWSRSSASRGRREAPRRLDDDPASEAERPERVSGGKTTWNEWARSAHDGFTRARAGTTDGVGFSVAAAPASLAWSPRCRAAPGKNPPAARPKPRSRMGRAVCVRRKIRTNPSHCRRGWNRTKWGGSRSFDLPQHAAPEAHRGRAVCQPERQRREPRSG